MRKTVVSGILIAGLLMAGSAMAVPQVDRHKADFKAFHQQEVGIRKQLRQHPEQAKALIQQLQDVRNQEKALRQSIMQAKMAAKKHN